MPATLVKLSRCPRRCTECRDEIRAEKAPAKVTREYPITYGSLSGHKVSFLSFRDLLRKSLPNLPESVSDDAGDSPEAEAEDEFFEGTAGADVPKLDEGDRVFATAYRHPTRGRSPARQALCRSGLRKGMPGTMRKRKRRFTNSFRPCSGISRMSLQRNPLIPFRTTGNGTTQ